MVIREGPRICKFTKDTPLPPPPTYPTLYFAIYGCEREIDPVSGVAKYSSCAAGIPNNEEWLWPEIYEAPRIARRRDDGGAYGNSFGMLKCCSPFMRSLLVLVCPGMRLPSRDKSQGDFVHVKLSPLFHTTMHKICKIIILFPVSQRKERDRVIVGKAPAKALYEILEDLNHAKARSKKTQSYKVFHF